MINSAKKFFLIISDTVLRESYPPPINKSEVSQAQGVNGSIAARLLRKRRPSCTNS